MKKEKRSPKDKNPQHDPELRKRTDLPGQNPRANDAPSHSLYNDENRPRK